MPIKSEVVNEIVRQADNMLAPAQKELESAITGFLVSKIKRARYLTAKHMAAGTVAEAMLQVISQR